MGIKEKLIALHEAKTLGNYSEYVRLSYETAERNEQN